jgi:uncharacterized protein (TIGR03067 family)
VKCLMILFVAFSVSIAATNADDKKDDPAKKDLKALQGTWVTLKLVVDGEVLVDLKEPPKDEEAGTLTYDEHKWVLKLGDKELARGTSKLDPTKTPKQIDLIHESGPNKGKTLLGIYELDGGDCWFGKNDRGIGRTALWPLND